MAPASSIRRRFGPLGAVAIASFALAACGGGNGEGTPGGTTAGTATDEAGNPAAGKRIYTEQGCGTCHAFKAAGSTGAVGPDLDVVLDRDAERSGKPLDEFVRESIVEPDAFIAPGFKRRVMPQTFGAELSEQELADLVAFLTQN